jgi:hypothetical protein
MTRADLRSTAVHSELRWAVVEASVLLLLHTMLHTASGMHSAGQPDCGICRLAHAKLIFAPPTLKRTY